jgi:hypothetical protein
LEIAGACSAPGYDVLSDFALRSVIVIVARNGG